MSERKYAVTSTVTRDRVIVARTWFDLTHAEAEQMGRIAAVGRTLNPPIDVTVTPYVEVSR